MVKVKAFNTILRLSITLQDESFIQARSTIPFPSKRIKVNWLGRSEGVLPFKNVKPLLHVKKLKLSALIFFKVLF